MENNNLIENELIILSKQTIDEFLKESNPGDLMALYMFYYYTAKWQKTNQPKCVDKYVLAGLKWGRDRFNTAKTTLLKTGLIEPVCDRKADGTVKGWYIRLNYMFRADFNHNTQNPQVVNPTSGFQPTNALSSINLNALSSIKYTEPRKTSDSVPSLLPTFHKVYTDFLTEKGLYFKETYPGAKNGGIFKKLEKMGVSAEQLRSALDNYARDNFGSQNLENLGLFFSKWGKWQAGSGRGNSNESSPEDFKAYKLKHGIV